MVESVRDVCAASIAAHAQRPRAAWVLEWPGQAVLVAAATHWTADLTAALTSPTPGALQGPLLLLDWECTQHGAMGASFHPVKTPAFEHQEKRIVHGYRRALPPVRLCLQGV